MFAQVCQALGLPLDELEPPDPAARLRERAERLRQAIERRLAGLVRLRRSALALGQRIEQNEERLQRLYVGALTWERAAELERIRQTLECDRLLLRRRELAYQGRLLQLQDLRRKAARIKRDGYGKSHNRAVLS